jgi:hypothetical protein
MIRERITIQDYERISRENEYYLWHFVRKSNTGPVMIYSYFEEEEPFKGHQLKGILDKIHIPYFESYLEDSFDFLIDLGISAKLLWQPEVKEFNTIILAFNKRRKVTSTFEGHCMCLEGVLDMIYILNPQYILNVKLD